MGDLTEREGLGAAAVAALLILGPLVAAHPLPSLGAALVVALAGVLVGVWRD